mgnify:CR=1 FL=1
MKLYLRSQVCLCFLRCCPPAAPTAPCLRPLGCRRLSLGPFLIPNGPAPWPAVKTFNTTHSIHRLALR